jgi:hypothetical protein
MLQAQCDQALLLDNSIHKKYASQHAPERAKYRPRKQPKDSFQEELERLKAGVSGEAQAAVASENAPEEQNSEFDLSALEREAAEFMRLRRRK